MSSSSKSQALESTDIDSLIKGVRYLDVLTGQRDYQIWCFGIRAHLRRYDLADLINEDWRQTFGIDEHVDVEDLPRKTQRVIEEVNVLLFQTVDKTLKHKVTRSPTPFETWREFERDFQPKGPTGIYRVVAKRESIKFVQTGSENKWQDLQRYLDANKDVTAEAADLGIDPLALSKTQALRIEIYREMIKLPREDYSAFIDSAVKNITDYRSLDQFRNELRTWGLRTLDIKGLYNESPNTQAVATALTANIKSAKCSHCGMKGHLAETCYFDEKHAHLRPTGWTPKSSKASINTANISRQETETTWSAYSVRVSTKLGDFHRLEVQYTHRIAVK